MEEILGGKELIPNQDVKYDYDGYTEVTQMSVRYNELLALYNLSNVMIYLLLALCFLTAGCSFRSTYPTLGAIAGGATGSLAGPGGAALGAGIGAVSGEALKNRCTRRS